MLGDDSSVDHDPIVRPRGCRASSTDGAVAYVPHNGRKAPALIMEVSILHQTMRAVADRDASALVIAMHLRQTVTQRFNLFWLLQRGDFPKGRRIPKPTLRAWDIPDPSPGERQRAMMRTPIFDGPLATIEECVAAVEKLCKVKPVPSELEEVRRLWPNYRFSNMVGAERRRMARRVTP